MFLHTMILAMIYAVLAMGLNLQLGFTGLYNFGHVAFFGIGAYTSALMGLAGMPPTVGMAFAMLTAGAAGFLLAVFALRLTGDFFRHRHPGLRRNGPAVFSQ